MKINLLKIIRECENRAIINYYDVCENPSFAEGFEFSYIPTHFFMPCSTPVLITILSIVASSANILYGIVL